MSIATLELVSPTGVPVTLTVTKDDATADIIATLERADKICAWCKGQGWGFTTQPAAGPSPAELEQGPTFCGYPCSPTLDDKGFPTWIVVDGQQAMRREKQGDTWYSARRHDGTYEQVLRIPKGEAAPKVKGL
jgi:hypothetical protein